MMARLALAVGSCLVACGYSRCTFVSDTGGTAGVGSSSSGGYGSSSGGSSSGGMVGGGNYTTTLILRDSSGVPATSFVMGESIRFDLEIVNNDNQATTLQFPDAQIYDFYVLDGTLPNTRWTWSDGMSFAQVATQLSFTAYGSKSYSIEWSGVLSNGTQLPVGNYRARGAIVAGGGPVSPLASGNLNSNIVNFTVR